MRNVQFSLLTSLIFTLTSHAASPTPKEVLAGLQKFYQKTAQANGFFTPGIDPKYLGMSDCAYSDLAAVTYACTVHKTFGWKLPHEKQTIAWLQSRQHANGSFYNKGGTVDPGSPQGQTYNTTQGLVALHALGAKPKHDPLPIFESIAKGAHKTLPPYSTSFFPLAYLCAGKPIPEKVDKAIRATMVQDRDGYLNDHIAATYHASHYYQLVGEPTPKSKAMVTRTLREQKKDGSWMLFMPSRDRHATFDAVFVLKHEGHGRKDCKDAIDRAAQWALSCRNPDGGFGHFPGSTSDADAIYFHVGTLIMAGWLQPVDPLPRDAQLLSWGHLLPVIPRTGFKGVKQVTMPGWVGGVGFSADGKWLGCTGGTHLRMVHATDETEFLIPWHEDLISSFAFAPQGHVFATGSYDHSANIWTPKVQAKVRRCVGHKGAILDVAFSPDGKLLATGSVDRTIRLWDTKTGKEKHQLKGHGSWVNAVRFSPNGKLLLSGSSDGTVRIWDLVQRKEVRSLRATKAEVRAIAISPDGKQVAAGIRYGLIKIWDIETGKEVRSFQGHESDVWAVAFSPDGKLLATGNGNWNRAGQVKLWDVKTGQLIRKLGHTGEVLSLAFSPTGDRMAIGGGDK